MVMVSAVILCFTTPAAADVKDWTLGFSPTYAFVVLEDATEPEGGGGLLFLTYGITDAVALRGSAGWSGHDVGETLDSQGNTQVGGLFHVLHFSAGLSYEFDILTPLSPTIEAAVELLHRRFAQAEATDFGVQLGICLDYWIRPWLALGAAFHYHAFVTNLADFPVYFSIGPRVAIRWR
jgi:hypothetical protein